MNSKYPSQSPMWTLYCISENDLSMNSNNGHNDSCNINSVYCSAKMAPGNKAKNICYWHWCRMADVTETKCKCDKKYYVQNGDSFGRRMLRQWCDKNDIESPKIIHDSIGNNYCCIDHCSTGNGVSKKCGNILLCNICVLKHPKCVDITKDDDEDVVSYVALPEGGLKVRNYLDAMKVHLHFVEIKDKRAQQWLELAKQLPGCPTYV